MSHYDNFLKSRHAKRINNNKHIKNAMRGITPRTADLIFDLSNRDDNRVDINRRANIKAIELVSDLIGSFHLPVRPILEYHGMVKEATDNGGNITDGVVKVGATIRTLMGSKVNIDIPVIVRNGSLVEPAVFFFDQAPYVMCGPALDDLVTRGALRKEMQPRGMYDPPGDLMPEHPDNYPRTPIVNQEHMFSPGYRNPWTFQRGRVSASKLDTWRNIDKNSTDKKTPSNPKQRDEHVEDWMKLDKTSAKEVGHRDNKPRQRTNIDTPTEKPELWEPGVPDAYLDVAERDREGLLEPGTTVSLDKDIQARDRGGGYLVIPSGEEGKVLRDMEGDGKMLYISFPAMGITTPVPKRMLKSAANVDQVRHEVKQMIREGYPQVDIKEAIIRRYPEHADEALQGLS